MKFTIEPLTRDHERGSFDCGEPALDEFIARYAKRNQERGISRTFVATRPSSLSVCGFYTIASGSVTLDEWPLEIRRKLPRHPVPVVTLGRLAVDRSARGEGRGKLLLIDVIRRVLTVSGHLGVFALVVAAKHESARDFYLKFGFIPFPSQPLHLFLPLATIRTLMAEEP